MSEEDKDRAPLSASDWERVKKVFREAIAIGPEGRAEFVQSSCAGDTDLIAEIDSLIASFERASEFLETPAIQEIATQFDDQKPQLKSGDLLAHYRIVAKIDSGGMGEVYLADDTRLDRKVAIKLLNRSLAEDRSSLKRFLREAKIASGLNHPNIMTVHEVGESADKHYLVCEFIEGEILRKRIRGSRVRLRESVDLLIQIASALEAAHKMGIVHRDIKPENVMVRKDGIAKVLDFGLAKPSKSAITSSDPKERAKTALTTQKGMILGTVAYMSPEQTRGKKTDARSDIWSFGVLLFQLVSGRLPFDGETTSDVLASVLKSDPDPLSELVPGIPEKLEEIARKCLRKKASKRYQNAEELLRDLRNLKNDLDKTDPGDLELTRSLPREDGDRETDGELTEPTDGNGNDLLTRISRLISVRIPATGNALLAGFVVLSGLIGISAYAFLFSGDVYQFETRKIVAPDGMPADAFASALAMSDDTLVITSTGDDDNGTGTGAAYVFLNDRSEWGYRQKLIPEEAQPFSAFGTSVDVDGDTILVGAGLYDNPGFNEGAAFVFVRQDDRWVQQARLLPSDPRIGFQFGVSVAIEGDTAVIGANGGAVYIFERAAGEWTEKQKLTALDGDPFEDDQYGKSLDIYGNTLVVGAHWEDVDGMKDRGAVYIYRKGESEWLHHQKLHAPDGQTDDEFGFSVALTEEELFISAPYDHVGSNAGQGSVWVFSSTGGMWTETKQLIAEDGEENDAFGIGVSARDDRLIIGAPKKRIGGIDQRGTAYLFEKTSDDEGHWIETRRILSGDGAASDWFGFGAVALSAGIAVVGARQNDSPGAVDRGSAYIFDLRDESKLGYPETGYFNSILSWFDKTNRPPVAIAGEDQKVAPGGSDWANVVVDGSGSYDPEGDPLTYSWDSPLLNTSSSAVPMPFKLGWNEVFLTVEDGRGNRSSDAMNVIVWYDFVGFHQPIDNVKFNVVNAGQGVPLEFSLNDDFGEDIIEPGFPVSHDTYCSEDDLNPKKIPTDTADVDSLTYSAEKDRYRFVWKTEAEWAGTCRHFALRLNDGKTHTILFKFE